MEQAKGNEFRRVADITKKMSDVDQAIKRITSTSAINSKMNEKQRYQNELASVHKKIGELETKIAKKRQEMYREEKKLESEQAKEQKKKSD